MIRFSEPVTAEIGDFSVQSDPSSASYTDNPVTGIAGTDTDTVTLTLQNNLIAGEFVRVTVNSGLTDSTGNAIIVTQRDRKHSRCYRGESARDFC